MKEYLNTLGRREFIAAGMSAGAVICAGCGKSDGHDIAYAGPGDKTGREALFYEVLDDERVQCHVCPRACVIANGKRGFCGTRENRDGILYSIVYGHIVADNLDPIEKKPFYHFLPGTPAYSIATAGCNMFCKFCQNWQISQSAPEDLRSRVVSPADIASETVQRRAVSIAYTYNEPTVFTEFVYDCAVEGKRRGLHSVIISNGYINTEPLDRLCEVISAYKVDFKAFSRTFYRDITGGERDKVLDTIKHLHRRGIWMELVHLTIPTLNDSTDDFRNMADWILGEIGPDVPVHFTRFHPTYKLTNLPVTPVSTLERAHDILQEKGVRHVYIGNVPGHRANSTWCPSCGAEVIKRHGYYVDTAGLKNGSCGECGTAIPGVWD